MCCFFLFASLSPTSLLFDLCVIGSRSVVTRSSAQLEAEVLMLPHHIAVYAVCCLQLGVRVHRLVFCQTPALPFILHNDGFVFRYSCLLIDCFRSFSCSCLARSCLISHLSLFSFFGSNLHVFLSVYLYAYECRCDFFPHSLRYFRCATLCRPADVLLATSLS